MMISIIIPCFRSEKFLPETLETVGRQTHKNWELWVIEDGSKDSTEAIVDNFRLKNPGNKIHYRRLEKTKGPSTARNTGIQNSTGAWIAFLDSDDLWHPKHLETLLELAQKKQVDLSFCSVDFFDSETRANLGVWGPTEDDLKTFPETLFLRNYISPSGVLIKKPALEKTRFEEAREIQGCEDHDLWMTLIRKGVSFAWVPSLRVGYRKNHPGAATSNQEKMARADLAVLHRHLRNPKFGLVTKCKGLSQNYALLAEALLEKRKWSSLLFYLRSWCFNPFEFRRLKRLAKALGYLTLRLAD